MWVTWERCEYLIKKSIVDPFDSLLPAILVVYEKCHSRTNYFICRKVTMSTISILNRLISPTSQNMHWKSWIHGHHNVGKCRPQGWYPLDIYWYSNGTIFIRHSSGWVKKIPVCIWTSLKLLYYYNVSKHAVRNCKGVPQKASAGPELSNGRFGLEIRPLVELWPFI